MTEYYCTIFHFACGLWQVNLLSNTDAASVVIVLAVFKKGKFSTGPKNGTNEGHNTHTHTHKSYDKRKAEWAKWLQNFLWLVGSSLDELLEIVTLTIAKRYICEKQSHSGSVIHYAGLFGFRRYSWNLKFINAISPQSTGIIILETCLLLGRQTITKWILCKTV
jgi:hypothetical protein